MRAPFHGVRRAQIRQLKKVIGEVLRADTAEQSRASRQHRLPVVFGADADLIAAAEALQARCDAALALAAS